MNSESSPPYYCRHPGVPLWPWGLFICIGLLSSLVAPLQAADPFYTDLKSAGMRAYDRGDYDSALRDLRIASFGFLDEPDLLAEALTYLAMAQAASGDR